MKAYRSMMVRMGGVLLLAAAFGAVSVAKAEAGLIVNVCNDAACLGGGDTFVTDNAVGLDVDPAVGAITVVLPGGQVQSALTYPSAGSQADPFLNVRYVFTTAGPFIYTAQDGFTPVPGSPVNFVANASSGTLTGAAFTGTGTFAVPGGAFGTGAAAGPTPGPISTSFAAGTPAPYYLAIGIQATAKGPSGVSSGDATLSVPEPATMSLFGLGLFSAAMAARRRKAQGNLA